MIEGY